MARTARHVVTVDPHRGSPEIRCVLDRTESYQALVRQPDGSYDSLPACIEYLDHFGVRDKVAVMVAKFEDVSDFWRNRSFGLVFVDGDHSYERCRFDGSEALRIGGRVLFHDHEATWPGVTGAVSDLATLVTGYVKQRAGALAEIVR